MRQPLLVLPLLLVAAACAPRVTAQRAALAPACAAPAAPARRDTVPAARVRAEDVRVFADLEAVPGPYTVVGFLSAKAGPVLDAGALRNSLRRRAGELGANGVVFDERAWGLGSVDYRCIPAVRLGAS